jgi:hypothetical protein
MQYKLLAQLPENNPNDYTEMGTVDVDKAIEAVTKYDWEKQYHKIKNREEQCLTSALPKLIIQNGEQNESLAISKDTDYDFYIEYSLNNRKWSESFSGDFNKNNSGLDEINFIVAFFEHKLERYFLDQAIEQDYTEEQLDELFNDGKSKSNEDLLLGNYRLSKILRKNMWFLIIPLLFLSIMAFSTINILISLAIVGLFYALMLISYSPYFFTLIQYIRFPKIVDATISKDGTFLDINYSDRTSRIYRSDILQCVYTYNSEKSSSVFSNVVITLKDKRQFFLTSITFTSEELNIILNRLNINIYKFDFLYPFVRAKIITDDFGINFRDYSSIEDLEEIYANYTDKMLNEILFNEDEYQPEAVTVAKKEIELRRH